ncbi:MAG: Trk system potassium transporter TrkA [Lentisphaerae bacterium]|nr:Trk system potassium transporter TrkA [Lentisphaerota bacterium]
MRILIIGAGNTGLNLSGRLCELGHDIVVIDISVERLAVLESHFDVLTIEGSGSSPDILEKAEVDKADLLIAVTSSDEVNILACEYAHAAGVKNTVARVSNPSLTRSKRLDFSKLGVDLMVSHKHEAADEMFDILRHPGLMEAIDLLDGRVLIAGIRIKTESPLLGRPLIDFKSEPIVSKIRFLAYMRGNQLDLPHGNTRFHAYDDLYLAVKPDDVSNFLDWACPGRHPFEKIVVAGGGDLGLDLSRRLEAASIPTVLLERDPARADVCSDALRDTLVLKGDASDQETLINAGVGPNTAFVAITGDEELNIVSCILAEKMGAAFTIAQVVKPEYVPIIRSLNLLDRIISPYMSMINAILHFVRGHHVKTAVRLHKAPGELLHVVVPERHRWAGKAVKNLKIPRDCVIATVLRNEEIYVPTGDLTIQSGDQLVIFALPGDINRVQAIFKN